MREGARSLFFDPWGSTFLVSEMEDPLPSAKRTVWGRGEICEDVGWLIRKEVRKKMHSPASRKIQKRFLLACPSDRFEPRPRKKGAPADFFNRCCWASLMASMMRLTRLILLREVVRDLGVFPVPRSLKEFVQDPQRPGNRCLECSSKQNS